MSHATRCNRIKCIDRLDLFFLVDFNRNFISLHTLPSYLTLFLYASLFVDIVAVAQ